jgi:hypothetical protein
LIEPDKTPSYCHSLLEGWEGGPEERCCYCWCCGCRAPYGRGCRALPEPRRRRETARLRLGRHRERARARLGRRHEMARASLRVPAPDQEDAADVCASMPNTWGRVGSACCCGSSCGVDCEARPLEEGELEGGVAARRLTRAWGAASRRPARAWDAAARGLARAWTLGFGAKHHIAHVGSKVPQASRGARSCVSALSSRPSN